MKDRVFRDPVHGLIEFKREDRDLARILETRAFQRLRRIHQMGFAWLVYPGAEHSRFGHTLGTFHLARRITTELELDSSVARHVKVAALLHDIGHGPFSHSWEHVFGGADHESWGARIATEEPQLVEVLEELEPGLSQTLAGFWDKSYRPSFARKLVSSQIDVDRLDYLLRDGHYSGARYAAYDLDWILYSLRLEEVEGGEDAGDLVLDYRRGRYAVEQYLFSRTYMYAQVYHHKTVRAAEWMFLKLLGRFAELTRAGKEPPGLPAAGKLARGEPLTVFEYLALDDISVTAAIDRWAGRGPEPEESDPILGDLARRLVDRRLFKTIDLGDDPSVRSGVEEAAREAARARFGESASFYYEVDTAQQVGYRADGGEDLLVVGHPRYGTVPLGKLLEDLALARRTSKVRLLCAPELVDALEPIAERALAGATPVDHSRHNPEK